MVVQHNLAGMNANRQLNITAGFQAKSSEKLSSGYKINRAADDAAGLSISEKMRRQIRGLTQGGANAQDGVSWCQIADGALDEVDNMLERVKELAIQAANETLTDTDRSYIDQEVQKISTEIDRIHASTKFNDIPIFDGGMGPSGFQRASNGSLNITVAGGKNIEITMPFVGSDGNKAEISEVKATGTPTPNGDSELAQFVQIAAANAVTRLADKYPKLFARASSPGIQVGLDLSGKEKNGTLATASINLSGNSTSTVTSYKMWVDTVDYPVESFPSMSSEDKAKLAEVIGHEMTHLVMYDTVTSGMLGGFPLWFVEGAAQATSGDNGWVNIDSSSPESKVKNYMSQLASMPYGAGYMGTMYLGQLASGESGVSSSAISKGLDNLLEYVADGHSFDEAIEHFTPYSGQTAFESGFAGADEASYQFVRDLLTARGDVGIGSIIGDLSSPVTTVYGNIGSSEGTDYKINRDSTWYGNAFGTGYDFPDSPGGSTTASTLYLQVGSENSENDIIPLKRYALSVDVLTNMGAFDVKTSQSARNTIDVVEIAATNVSRIRSYYGALQNRLEHTVKNLGNVVENTTASESRIRDTDMAKEMVDFSNKNILAQAGQSMLAQANQTNQGVLSLLQ